MDTRLFGKKSVDKLAYVAKCLKELLGVVYMRQWLFYIRSRTFFLLLVFFLILTYLAYAKIIAPLDNSIENYVHSLAGNTPVDLAMQIFTETGWILYLIIFSFILLVKKDTRRLGLVLLLCIIIASMISAYLRC